MPSPRTRRRQSGFSIHELLVVIVLVMVIVAFNVPADAAARRTARRMQNSTQLRGIHQGLVTFANSNKNNFPGFNSKGEIIADGKETTGNSGDGDTVQARFWIMLEGDFFTPEYAVSPSEVTNVTYAEVQQGAIETIKWDDNTKHYSYAMLGIKGVAGEAPDAAFAGRAAEWKQTLNSQAIVLSDRNTGTNATDKVQSIHTDDLGDWTGSVLWNDNHVAFEQTHYFETKYANGRLHDQRGPFNDGSDNLFSSERDPNGQSGVDALMVIAGDDTVHAGE